MYTDIGTKLMGSHASPPVFQSVAAATTAGLLSESWIDLLEGIRSEDQLARSLGEGIDLIANFAVGTALAAGTANVTADLRIVALPRTTLAAVAFTAAASDVCTSAAHGLENGTCVTVATTTTLPAGLAAATHYFVIEKTADTFKLSLTPGGAAVDITDAGTGTHSFTVVPQVIGASGPVPLRRLAAGSSQPVRVNPLGTSKQQPRHRYIFALLVPSANLTAGTMICDVTHASSNEQLHYPSGQIA